VKERDAPLAARGEFTALIQRKVGDIPGVTVNWDGESGTSTIDNQHSAIVIQAPASTPD